MSLYPTFQPDSTSVEHFPPHMLNTMSKAVQISDEYHSAITSFKELAALLYSCHGREIRGEHFIVNALEVYGRLRVWGEETRATLPAVSRSSLDDTLRKNIHLSNMVINILAKIRRQAENGKACDAMTSMRLR